MDAFSRKSCFYMFVVIRIQRQRRGKLFSPDNFAMSASSDSDRFWKVNRDPLVVALLHFRKFVFQFLILNGKIKILRRTDKLG